MDGAIISEGDGVYNMLVEVEGAPPAQPHAFVLNVEGSADLGFDFDCEACASVAIPVGATRINVALTIADDALVEGDETIILSFGATSLPINSGAPQVELVLADNDPGVAFVTSVTAVTEADGAADLAVVIDNLPIAPMSVVVSVNLEASTAVEGVDYHFPSPAGATLTWPADGSSVPGTIRTLSIPLINNGSPDNPSVRTLVLQLADPTNGAVVPGGGVHVVEIGDDDRAVSFDTSQLSVVESRNKTLTASLTPPAQGGEIVTLVVGAAGGDGATTAVLGADFTIAGDLVVVLEPLQTSLTWTVVVPNDNLIFGEREAVLTLSSETYYFGPGGAVTLTVVDDDPAIYLDVDSFLGNHRFMEGTTATLTFVSSAPAIGGESLVVVVSGADAATVTPLESVVVFQTGATEADLVLSFPDDAVIEFDKTLTITVASATASSIAVLLEPTMLNIVLTDNDPSAAFASATVEVSEDVGLATALVQLSAPAVGGEVIAWNLDGSTAIPGVHYTPTVPSRTVTLDAGSTSLAIEFNVINNNQIEGDRFIVVTLEPSDAGLFVDPTSGALTQATIVIQDKDPVLSFVDSSLTVAESSGMLIVSLALSVAASGSETAVIAIASGGSAAEGTDMVAGPYVVTFAAGAVSADLVVTIVDDTDAEEDETFTLIVLDYYNAFSRPQVDADASSLAITITDDDVAVALKTVRASVLEGTTLELTITLSTPAAGTETVDLAVEPFAPADWVLDTPSLVFATGSREVVASVSIPDDDAVEATASFELVITGVSSPSGLVGIGTKSRVLITVNDNDPSLGFATPSTTVSESSGVIEVTITAGAPVPDDVLVPLSISGTATSGVDYALTSAAFFAAGSASSVVSLEVLEDCGIEPDETVVLVLSSDTLFVTPSASTHTVTIKSNDPEFSMVSSGAEAVEGDQPQILVTTCAVTDGSESLQYTVTGDATYLDYGGGSTPVPAGVSTFALPLDLVNNAAIEAGTFLQVTLTSASSMFGGASVGVAATYTLQVADNDPTVSFTVASSEAYESEGSLAVAVRLNAAPPTDTTVFFELTAVTAAPTDAVVTSETLIIPAGSLTRNILVTLVDNNVVDGDRELVIT